MDRFKASYYTRAVSHGDWTLLFNGVTSGLVRLPNDIGDELKAFLGTARSPDAGTGLANWNPPRFAIDDLPDTSREIFPELLRGHFFVSELDDEIRHLRERMEFYKKNEPFLVTITTTLDCNFDCYYCYEERSPIYLSRDRCDDILDWIKGQIAFKAHDKLYTDWYGGEPMLNRDAIDYFSDRAIAYCDENGIDYSSAMISNGTLWPDDAKAFALKNRIRHVQFTLDGPPQFHDKRRRFDADGPAAESFRVVSQTITRLLGATRIYLRINVDPAIGRSVLSMPEYFKEQGWLEPGVHVYPYLASIGPMTEHCGFVGESPKFRSFQKEFDRLNHDFQGAISKYIDPRGIQHLQYYPMTIKMNCAAVGENSVVFGPDGMMYKCGLDVGHAAKAFAALPQRSAATASVDGPFVILNSAAVGSAAHDYEKYDPFSHHRCSQCQYLPICMGGCPKTQFENNEFYLKQQSAYWEDNFETVLRTYADSSLRRS
ncbi:MAG: radical SAM protein [Bryobacteraceae bacterium]